MKPWIFLTMLLSAMTGYAQTLTGVWQQGGYLQGRVAVGSAVTVNGEAAVVGADGSFLYGLKRHFPTEAVVAVTRAGVTTQTTVIITPRTYKVQHITGVAKNKVNPDKQELARIRRDSDGILAARSYKTVTLVPGRMIFPVTARQSGVYGSSRTFNGEERSWHKGLDLAAPKGTSVKAPAAGIVRFVGETFFSGNLVIIDHGLGLFGHYAHLNDTTVKVGQNVAVGEVIGHVGATGRVTGPHLHWGLYWQNVAVDPLLWVE